MADALTIEVGATAVVPVAFESAFGVAAGPAPAEVAAEAPSIATVQVVPEGIEVAGVSIGTTQVTLTMNGEADHMPVTVVAPVAKHARMLTAAATFRATK